MPKNSAQFFYETKKLLVGFQLSLSLSEKCSPELQPTLILPSYFCPKLINKYTIN